MNRGKVNIEEMNHNVSDSRSMVFKVIDSQINNYKLQLLSEWERDHTISRSVYDEKIKALEAKKEALIAVFNRCEVGRDLVDFKISIDVTVKNNMAIAV